MSVIREWAAFVCAASAASLPAAERAVQRRHVADTLLAAVAGNRTGEGRALRALFAQPALAEAIGMQAAVIRHTEIDDIHLRSCTTPSSVAVPAALALALARTAGIRAAAGAQQGVGGDPDLLDGPWLRDAQGLDADLAALTARLGEGSVYREMSLKPFCSAKQSIAAVEAVIALLEGGLSADTITHVRVRVPPPYARMIATKADAGSRSSTIMSVAFQLGLAAERRQRLYDIERSEITQDAAVQKFAQLVEVVPDENLLEGFPACWPAELEVYAGDQIFRKRVMTAIGDPARPLDDAQLRQKAQRVLA